MDRFLYLLVFLVVATGCSPFTTRTPQVTPVGVEEPTRIWFVRGATLYPQDWYYEAYTRARACAGNLIRPEVRGEGAFFLIQWRTADAILETPSGRTLAGMWVAPHTIWFDESYANNWETVYHELLHEVLGSEYSHETEEFRRCVQSGRG